MELLLGSGGLDSVDLPSFLEDRNPLESLLGTVEHQFGAQGVSSSVCDGHWVLSRSLDLERNISSQGALWILL